MVVKTTTEKPCFGSWWECVTNPPTTEKPWNWWGRNDLEKNDLEENDLEKIDLEKNDLERNGLEETLINDETVESMAFEICNTDGVDGLSWAEVEQCEVIITVFILNSLSKFFAKASFFHQCSDQ